MDEDERIAYRKKALDFLQAERKPLLDAAKAAKAASQANPRNTALAEAADQATYKYRISSPLGQDIDNMATMLRNEHLGIIPGKSAAKRPPGERGGRRRYKSKKYHKSRRPRRLRRSKKLRHYKRI